MASLAMCGFAELGCRPCYRGANPWKDTVKVKVVEKPLWRAVSLEGFEEDYSPDPRRAFGDDIEEDEEEPCAVGYVEEHHEDDSQVLAAPPPGWRHAGSAGGGVHGGEVTPGDEASNYAAHAAPASPLDFQPPFAGSFEEATPSDEVAGAAVALASPLSGSNDAPAEASPGSSPAARSSAAAGYMETIHEAGESVQSSCSRPSFTQVPGAGVGLSPSPAKAEGDADDLHDGTASELEAKAWIDEFLRRHGYAGVNARRTKLFKSKYPLHTAVKLNNEEVVRLLLWAGADPTLRNSSGLTPRQLGERYNYYNGGTHEKTLATLRAHDESHRAAARVAGA